MRLDGRVAFTGTLSQALDVEQPDMSAPVADEAGRLQRIGHQRDAGPPNPEHFGKKLLSQSDIIAAEQIIAAQ